ncbi:MAG TPA: ankyrin repeat domain-containing protein [Azonexus sp.]|nr:ankyrin repeat domain-containing protein [Azonexus sp.]
MELLKAIRAGQLTDVKAALDAGASLDDEGQPGFALGMACFLGHAEIVRELALRGAPVNCADNSAVTAPLAMALRGGRKEVVRTLLELGAVLPAGMQTGLSEQEIKAAQWIAFRDGRAKPDDEAVPVDGEVEEIQITRLSHVDTQVLEADALRAVLGKD